MVIADARSFPVAVDARHRLVAVFVVEVEAVPAVSGLAEQAQTVPGEVGLAEQYAVGIVVAFADTPAERVNEALLRAFFPDKTSGIFWAVPERLAPCQRCRRR